MISLYVVVHIQGTLHFEPGIMLRTPLQILRFIQQTHTSQHNKPRNITIPFGHCFRKLKPLSLCSSPVCGSAFSTQHVPSERCALHRNGRARYTVVGLLEVFQVTRITASQTRRVLQEALGIIVLRKMALSFSTNGTR